ncbi:MAG TPA: class I SAM-dependent methyltransferase [Acidimicrobiales bacterium]|nr:class I SAM-dependent methyltransferase [Acidimicrobiales bacterium]
MANEAETRRWNDERWAAAWPKRERLTETVTPYLLDAIGARPGQRIHDIGCGGGGLALALAKAVAPGGEVVGVDLSAPLLELARSRADEAGVGGLRFVQLDMQTDPLGEPPFDLAVSQFGVMFFDEPTAAFGAVRRTLAAQGRLVFACWQGVELNPWHTGIALRPFVVPPPVPPPGKSPVGPFALGDDEYVRELLEGAGFGTVTATAHRTSVRGPASAIVDPSLLPMMGIRAGHEDEARAALEAHLAQFAAGDLYEYPLAFRIYDAVNDGG